MRLANVLLPGRGLRHGPFVTEEEIRTMAEVGHEGGVIDARERELIHAAFVFGDTVVREVMVPRPDVIAVEVTRPLRDFVASVLEHGHSRVPVYRGHLDHMVGVIYVKDVLRHLAEGRDGVPLGEVVRPAHFVPESKRVADLLKDWDTVGGLMLGLLGAIPREGQEVRCERVTFKAEKVQRRRVLSVLVTVASPGSIEEPAPGS